MSIRIRMREEQQHSMFARLVKLKVCFVVLCISSQSYRNPQFGEIACAFRATVKAKRGKKSKRKTQREKSWRGVYEYTSLRSSWKVLGTLTVSAPGPVGVKAPGCERWRPRPVRAAPLPDTSLSSAACGFETSPHCVGHHELHLGKSIAHTPQRVHL